MAAVVVRPVTSWGDRRRFLNLPEQLYRGDPYWIPRLRIIEKELVGYKHHPFHETAEVQTFLATRGDEVCGRVAAIINREHNREHKEERGFFGFFETVDDPAVAHALLDAVRDWLAARGITKLRGPANPSMNYDCGLLVEGFDSPPTFLMTYNPPFYARLIEEYGFQKVQDLLAYIGYKDQLPAFEENLGWLVDQEQERCQATVRPMTVTNKDVELFLELYNRSFEAMWGFVPLTKHEMTEFVRTLSYLVSPELAPLPKSMAGAWARCWGCRITIRTSSEFAAGCCRSGSYSCCVARRTYAASASSASTSCPSISAWGLGLVLLRSLVPKALSMGVEEAEFSWIAESNVMPRVGLEKMNAKLIKTFRMYDLDR